ncbi:MULTISPECIES: hypothetical protein [Colwellia]|nr:MULTISPECIES: hypothetical protein [Colwellia]
MPSNLLAMISIRNPKAIAISYLLVVNRLWQVKRQLNWPVTAEH